VIVVDAGVVTAALVDDGDVGAAARAALVDDVHWMAPAHLLVEVVSAVRGLVLGRKVSARRGGDAIRALPDLAVDIVDPADLVERMWALRDNVSPYDAAYVAVAEREGCDLVTTDRALKSQRAIRCRVRLIQ
jgi:predicted nucleic acid-binding protein